MKKEILILLLSLPFVGLMAAPITVSTTSEMEKSEVEIIVQVLEEPYTVSVQYNDTDLSKSSGSDLNISGDEYKLTEEAVTKPFYVNLSSGVSDQNYEFIIEIEVGEFIGEDYLGDLIYTDIYPTINSYRDYHYSFTTDPIDKIATMNYYQPSGVSDAKHIGAFTFSWDDNAGLSAGLYTSTNTINITSENAIAPQVL